jgi:cell division protease FtsH
VDAEVKRVLDEAYQTATRTLKGDMETLHHMAAALLERETIDREEVDLIMAGKTLPPRSLPTPPRTPPTTPAAKPSLERAPGMLGAPPAEPAGA